MLYRAKIRKSLLDHQVILLFLLIFISGCSSSIFKGTADKQVQGLARENQFAKNCSGLRLAEATIDVPTARELVRCLNNNGSIQAYQDFLDQVSDPQLAALIDVVNREVLLDPLRLKKLDKTFLTLADHKIVDLIFNDVAALLENSQAVASLLELIERVAFKKTGNQLQLEPDLIHLFQGFSQYWDSGTLAQVFDFSGKVVQSRAFEKLSELFQRPSSVSIDTLSSDLFDVFLSRLKDPESQFAKSGTRLVAQGTLSRALDRYFDFYGQALNPRSGAASSSSIQSVDEFEEFLSKIQDAPVRTRTRNLYVDQQVAALQALFKDLARDDRWLHLGRLFRNLSHPIQCLSDPQRLPNALGWVLDEMSSGSRDPHGVAEFLARPQMLMVALAGTMCQFPENFSRDFRELTPFLESGSAEISAALFQSLRREDSSSRDLQNFFVDTLSHPVAPRLKNTIQVGTEKNILSNLIYLLFALDPSTDRRQFESFVKVFLAKPEVLQGKTYLEIILGLLGKMTEQDKSVFTKLIVDGSAYFDASRPAFLAHLILNVRDAHLLTNLHPFEELLQSLGTHAESYRVFYETLFKLAKKPEFTPVLDLTVRLSRSGAMRDLLMGIFMIFRRSGEAIPLDEQIISQIPEAPRFLADRDRSSDDLPTDYSPRPFVFQSDSEGLSCRELDPGISIFDVNAPSWSRQWRGLAACINSDGSERYADVVRLIRYGFSERIYSDQVGPSSQAKSLWQTLVELLNGFFPTSLLDSQKQEIQRELGRAIVDQKSDFDKIFDLSRLLIVKDQGVSILENALKLMPSVVEPALKNHIENIKAWLGSMMGSESIVKVLQWLGSELNEESPTPLYSTTDVPLPSPASLRSLVNQTEHLSGAALENRIQEIYTDFQEQPRNDYGIRQYEDFDHFYLQIKKFLDALARPRHIESLLGSLLQFFENPYSALWWAQYFYRLSTHVVAVPYYYPNSEQPVIRLLNDLDRLELVVLDANFRLRDYGLGFIPNSQQNFALKYLSYLAKSQGNLWDSIETMEAEHNEFFHLPPPYNLTLPSALKRKLSNLSYVLPVLRQLYGGQDARDMLILSDQFNALLSAVPPSQQVIYTEDASPLEAILQLCQIGVLRNVGRMFHDVDPSSGISHVMDFRQAEAVTRTLVKASVIYEGGRPTLNPSLLRILDFLLRNPKGQILTKEVLRFFYDQSRQGHGAIMRKTGLFLVGVLNRLDASAPFAASSSNIGDSTGATHLGSQQLGLRFVEILEDLFLHHSDTIQSSLDLFEIVLTHPGFMRYLNRLGKEASLEPSLWNDVRNFLLESLRDYQSRDLGSSLAALLEKLYLNPSVRPLLTQIRSRWNQVIQDDSYVQNDIDDVLARFVRWSGQGTPLGHRGMGFLSQTLVSASLRSIMNHLGCQDGPQSQTVQACSKPGEFYSQLEPYGSLQRTMDLKDFLNLVHRALTFQP